MNLELKEGGKIGLCDDGMCDDQQDKVDRNFRKGEGHNKEKTPSKQNEIKSISLPTVKK